MDYPERTCEIDRLVTHPKLVESALAGVKTQQRRDGLYAYPGENFSLEGVEFTVISVEQIPFGDMSEEDAKAEGYPNLAMYKDLIERMHPGQTLGDDHLVWLHVFEKTA